MKALHKIGFAFFVLLFFKMNAQDLIPFKKDTLWGYRDPQGNVKIEPEYDYATEFIFNYAIVLKNDSVGAIDQNKHIVIPSFISDKSFDFTLDNCTDLFFNYLL